MIDEKLEAAEGLLRALCVEYKATALPKESSEVMQGVEYGLDLASRLGLKVPNRDEFGRFSTTLLDRIYLPERVRSNPLALIEIGPHEVDHVLQWHTYGVAFPTLYLTDGTTRGQLEADAYATGIAVRQWATGTVPGPDDVARVADTLQRAYHVRADDRPYVEGAMRSYCASLRAGIVTSQVAKFSIAWLDARYPHLKEKF